MKKNLPYFMVIAALILLIVGVLSSGEREARSVSLTEHSPHSPEPFKQIAAPLEKPFEKAAVAEKPIVLARRSLSKHKPLKKVIFDFEKQTPYWEIPDWCLDKDDYVGKEIAFSSQFANKGKSSLEVLADFPGKKWSAAYLEVQEYFDWTPYQNISADVYVPANGPYGLKAKIILTVGDDWKWTEMSRQVKLAPGEWTTVTANLVPGSSDWRRTEVTDEFRSDVRKLGIRVESNMRPVYRGPLYVDNVRLE
jgi:hypothetical protein